MLQEVKLSWLQGYASRMGSVTLNELCVILRIAEGCDLRKPYSTSDLAALTGTSTSTISRIVSRGAKKGWLKVHLDGEDRRRHFICLTDKAWKMRQAHLKDMVALTERVLGVEIIR